MGRDDDRHDHGHWTRGGGNLRPCPPKRRREEAYGDGPIHAGDSSKSGRNTEGKRYWQNHHRSREAAKNVTSKSLETVGHVKATSII